MSTIDLSNNVRFPFYSVIDACDANCQDEQCDVLGECNVGMCNNNYTSDGNFCAGTGIIIQ